jgi:hypothetical protein
MLSLLPGKSGERELYFLTYNDFACALSEISHEASSDNLLEFKKMVIHYTYIRYIRSFPHPLTHDIKDFGISLEIHVLY